MRKRTPPRNRNEETLKDNTMHRFSGHHHRDKYFPALAAECDPLPQAMPAAAPTRHVAPPTPTPIPTPCGTSNPDPHPHYPRSPRVRLCCTLLVEPLQLRLQCHGRSRYPWYWPCCRTVPRHARRVTSPLALRTPPPRARLKVAAALPLPPRAPRRNCG